MADVGHERTNDIIDEMTKQIEKEYEKAAKAVEKKLNAYLKSFDQKEAEQLKLLEDGKITEQQFNTWRQTQLLTGQRWQDLLEQLTGEMVNANDIARSTIRGHMADVYTLNRNYAAYQVEQDAHIDTSWTLYNRRATENLFKNNDNLLPMPKPGGRAWQQMQNEDTRWNQQKINSSMIQGILQGDGIRELSGRLMHVVGMNENSAVRNARTMTTYVQNKARDDTFAELAEKGVEMEQQWVATLDDRTRSTHRWLHGEVRSEDGTYSNGLRFPGDPLGDPEEVYNCRCTEISHVKGFPLDIPRTSPKMTMDFDEWLGEKPERLVGVERIDTGTGFGDWITSFTPAKTREEAEAYADQFVSSYKSKYTGNVSYKGIGVEHANACNRVLTEIFARYDIDPLGNITPMNKRENRWKNSTADAAYQWGNGGHLFINQTFYKTVQTLAAHMKEAADQLDYVLKNYEVILDRVTGRKKETLLAIVQSGSQTIQQRVSSDQTAIATIVHECGHMLDDKKFHSMMKDRGFDVSESMKQYAKGISGYSTANPHEYVAESFCAWWFGMDDKVDPELARIFKEGQK